MQDFCGDVLGGFSQPIGSAGLVRDQDAEEQGLLASPVDSNAVHDAYHVRCKGALRPQDACPDLGLINQSAGHNRHDVIISRLEGDWGGPLPVVLKESAT